MKFLALALLAATPAIASASTPLALQNEAEISKYWIFDFEATRPLLVATGLDLVIPPELAEQHMGWSKQYQISIDSSGKVASARCMDCAADDPLQEKITASILLDRYKPAPGNPERTAITVKKQITMTPFGG